MTRDGQLREAALCFQSAAYFIGSYCQIEDPNTGGWLPFALWPEQKRALRAIVENLLVIILKARQLGLSWLVLAYALWLMLFRPAATVLLFSRRDDEAVHLLSDRLRGMFNHLPEWLRWDLRVVEDNDHEFALSNGSVARAFPTTGGDSYTATLVIGDEADLMTDFNRFMRSVKPTIDAGGQMLLVSRADKTRPQSEFKKIYRAARQGQNNWTPVFIPWHARPGRDSGWYEAQRRDVLSRTGALDDLHEQYPATDTEALAPRSLDKRIPGEWLEKCYMELAALPALPGNAPAIPGLEVYVLPDARRRYVIGVDPAEGNPTSDDSALEVLDAATGEECAALAGKFQPQVIAAHANAIGGWFANASVLVERNNHGHAVLLWLADNSPLTVLAGHDDKPGWLSNSRGKALLYDAEAEAFREGDTRLHSFATYTQLAGIEGASLRAPEDEPDDRADAHALATMARALAPAAGETWVY